MIDKKLLFCNLKYDLPECNQEVYEKMFLVYGLGIIQEIASRKGISYDYYDTYTSGSTNTFIDYYRENRQDVVLFSAISGNRSYQFLRYVFDQIRSVNPDATIVLGGTITSVYPEILLEEVKPDIIVIGEGEETFWELCQAGFSREKLSGIEGIGYTKNASPVINKPRRLLKSPLEKGSCNPLFDNETFTPFLNAYLKQQRSQNRGWEIAGSRGCVGNCTFCKRVFDKPIRYFSAEYIIDIMTHVKKVYGIDRFNFLDENFVVNRRNFKKFLNLLEEKEMDVKWRIRTRVDHIPFDLLDRMQKNGLYSVVVGVESANQDVLKYYNKQVDFSKHKGNLRELARRGLLFASFIIGAPVESEKSIRDNVEFIEYAGLTRKNTVVGYLSVIPGTAIFEECLKKGIIKSKRRYVTEYMGDFKSIELNISPLSDERLKKARDEMLDATKADSNG